MPPSGATAEKLQDELCMLNVHAGEFMLHMNERAREMYNVHCCLMQHFGATGLAVRSIMQAAKFLYRDESRARPDEGEKACESFSASDMSTKSARVILCSPELVAQHHACLHEQQGTHPV